jgi:pSer/pThr/pTyr-binding forkhead associated (FHA) protein
VVNDRTITLAKVDPLLDAPGAEDDVHVDLNEITPGQGILVIRSGDRVGEKFVLAKDSTTIGRHPDSDISLDDITVSRRHVEIVRTNNKYFVTDSGSLNGTYVNQRRVDSSELRQGDELQVGKYRFVFLEHAEDLR